MMMMTIDPTLNELSVDSRLTEAEPLSSAAAAAAANKNESQFTL